MNGTHNKSYRRLGAMVLLHVIAMYVLMYAMVNILPNALPNLNQLYMAILMATPMVFFEMWLMGSMYPNRMLNILILTVAAVCFIGSLFLIRTQTTIGDVEFLKSMIPHHAGAILMCEKASLSDAEIQELCNNIIQGQDAEIGWMKAKLNSLQP